MIFLLVLRTSYENVIYAYAAVKQKVKGPWLRIPPG